MCRVIAMLPRYQYTDLVRSQMEELASYVTILLIAPESLLGLVDASLRLPHVQAPRQTLNPILLGPQMEELASYVTILLVAPESLLGLVDASLRLLHLQGL